MKKQARWRDWGLHFGLLMLALLVGWVHRRTLVMFFGPDDIIHLEQASGLIPASTSPLRFLSQVAYFRAVLDFSGPYAPTFHLLSLLLHMINVVLVGLLARGLGLARASSLLAAGLFGLHPLVTPSLMYAVNINELMALAGFLVAVRLARSGNRVLNAIAPVALLGALFSKESVLLLPALAPALLKSPGAVRGARTGWLLLVAPTVAFATLFGVLALWGLIPRGDAYDVSVGPVTLANIGTYLRWLFDLGHPVPDAIGAPDMRAWPVAIMGLFAFGLAHYLFRGARRVLDVGAGWFILGGLPTFVLAHHSYAAYLYMPGVGLGIGLAAIFEGAIQRVTSWMREPQAARAGHTSTTARLVPVALGLLLLFAFAARSNALLRTRALARLRVVDLPSDPLARKSVIAGRAVSSMATALPPNARTAVLFAPATSKLEVSTLSGRLSTSGGMRPSYDLQATVLDKGRAFRLFFPQLDSVVFVDSLSKIDESCAVFSRSNEGYLGFHGMGVAGAWNLSDRLAAAGYTEDARAIAAMLADGGADSTGARAGRESPELTRSTVSGQGHPKAR